MTFDVFMKIDGIPGNSTDEEYREWIKLISYSIGIDQPVSGTGSGGGSGTGRPVFQNFSLVKNIDNTSPDLALASASGTHIKSVTIDITQKTEAEQTADESETASYTRNYGPTLVSSRIAEFYLENCVITSWYESGSFIEGKNVLTDEVSIAYESISFTYEIQKPDGSSGGQVGMGWDLTKNMNIDPHHPAPG
jgi:type VI secretion system secreted protein Hcp